jgi:DNA-binding SARP family transcriptional activator
MTTDGVVGPLFAVRLLGEVELRSGDTPLPALESARAELLLAYLLVHRDAPVTRQRVAFALWPDSSEAQARTNLRNVLHNLRRAFVELDRYLEVTARTLQWRPRVPWWLDVAAFERRSTAPTRNRTGPVRPRRSARRSGCTAATCSPAATTTGSMASGSGCVDATCRR